MGKAMVTVTVKSFVEVVGRITARSAGTDRANVVDYHEAGRQAKVLLADRTQRVLADESGCSQSLISRYVKVAEAFATADDAMRAFLESGKGLTAFCTSLGKPQGGEDDGAGFDVEAWARRAAKGHDVAELVAMRKALDEQIKAARKAS